MQCSAQMSATRNEMGTNREEFKSLSDKIDLLKKLEVVTPLGKAKKEDAIEALTKELEETNREYQVLCAQLETETIDFIISDQKEATRG